VGAAGILAVLAQPVQGLMLTEAAQFEMADFNDRCRNFGGKSTSHEQWPANNAACCLNRARAAIRLFSSCHALPGSRRPYS